LKNPLFKYRTTHSLALAVITKMTINEFEKRAEYQNGYDRKFDNWKVIDIHQVPTEFSKNDEIDFYCSNGRTVYLLRCRYRKTEFYEKIKSENIIYLIAEFPIKQITNDVIKDILKKF